MTATATATEALPPPRPRSKMTGKEVWLSVSAAGTFSACPRWWWYEKVAGRKLPPSDAMELGTDIHALIEGYIQHGDWTLARHREAPGIAPHYMALVQAAQAPLDELRARDGLVEAALRLAPGQLGPLPFFGKVDWHDRNKNPGAPRLGGGGPLVVDHKTTKDLKARWHLDEAGLAADLQMGTYAALLYPDEPGFVPVRHIYIQTSSPGCRVLTAQTTRIHRDEALGRMKGAAAAMAAHLEVTDPQGVEYRRTACNRYSGCPHASVCPDSPQNRGAKPASAIVTGPSPTTQKGENMQNDVMGALFGGSKPAAPPPQAPQGTDPNPGPAQPITPPDAPPTPTPTQAQVDEVARKVQAAKEAFGIVPNDDYIGKLCQRAGLDPEEHVSVVKIAAGITDGQPEHRHGAIKARGEATAKGTPAPARMCATCGQEEVPAEADVCGSCAQSFDQADARLWENPNLAPAKLEQAHTDALAYRFGHSAQAIADLKASYEAIRAFVANPGRKSLKHDNVKAVAREAIGIAGMGGKRWMALLAAGADAGFWDYSASEVLPPPAGGAAPAPQAAQEAPQAPEPTQAPPEAPEAQQGPQAATTVHISAEDAAGAVAQLKVALEGLPDIVARPRLVLVGCIPMSPVEGQTTMDEWLAEPIAALEAREGVPHYGLIEYNKGPAMVVAMVASALRDGRLVLPPVLVVPAFHPLESQLVGVLTRAGALVVRGVR